MVKSSPGMFCGYISSSQVVAEVNAQRGSYDATLALAHAARDADSVAKLEALGPPPWTNPRNPGILRRVMRKYEAMSTKAAPKAWWTPDPEYSTPKAEADYTAGEDYSWLQFVDLYKLGPKFAVPFYMVQGEQDLMTMPEPSKRYFDFIQAPRKEFVLVPRTGHDPNPPMLDAQYKLLKEHMSNCR